MGPEHERRLDATWTQRRLDPAASLREVTELLDELEPAVDDHDLGRLRLLEGSCRWRLSQYAEALRCLLAADDLLDPDAHATRAAARLDLGTVRTYFGQHDEALELLLDARASFGLAGDEHGRGDVLNNLGIVFFNRGDAEEAIRAYRESLELRRQLDDRDGVAGCHNNLAKVLTEQGAYDQALRELAAAERGWQSLDNRRGRAVALNNIGIVHHRRGELEAATDRFIASLELKRRIGDRQGACESLTHLGRIHTELGRYDRAREVLQRAVDDAEELGILAELADACAATSELEEAVGDHAAALAWFRRFHEVDRQLFDERSTERLQALQAAFQLERAEQEGATDALTGLANRRSLDRQLNAAFATARAQARELSLALLDLDGFKAVNDRFGHAVGDQVLKAMAGLLRDHTRTADVPARYGGEEFAVILPDTALPEAIDAARQLCERVRDHPWTSIDPDLVITVSVGVATATQVEDPEELLAAADRHLYRAKHAGKDRVVA